MQLLPLLGQDGAQLVKTFDEAGCQTSPPPSDSPLTSDPSTLLDFMSSFEELDEIFSGFDTTGIAVSHDVAAAPPPTYVDAVTHSDPSSGTSTLGLDLDRRGAVSGSPPRPPSMTPAYVGGPISRSPDETLARSQKIGHSLNPVPPGIYMRARPMVWDATPSAASTHEAHTFRNGIGSHHSQASADPDPKCSAIPPWRHPSIARTAFEIPSTHQGDVFGPYTHAPGVLHSQFDTAPHHRVARSLTYSPPSHRNHNPYFAPDARIDSWTEHAPPRDTPLPSYTMPGTYPPSPPPANTAPSYGRHEVYGSASRYPAMQYQGSLVRRTSSLNYGCESCYPSPPASPASSVRTDSRCSNYSSPSVSPALDLHLSLHSPSHPSLALHHEGVSGPARAVCSLNLTPPPSPGVVNISIALPAPCSRHDRLYHRVPSLSTILVPLVFLVPLAAYAFGASTARPSSGAGGRDRGSGGESLFHGPLVWRALSSLLSYVLRMMRDGDVKI